MAKKKLDGLEVEDGYDAWASSYDQVANRTRDLDAKATREVLDDFAACSVLELGCGTGKNTVWLAGRFDRVTALDLSHGMLTEARRKLGSAPVEFLQHDVSEPLPFGNGSFDLVTCNLTLEHIKDISFVFTEVSRVLQLSGRLFVCEFHPYRQFDGRQAECSSASQDAEPITAYVHSFSEYVNDALAAGLSLTQVHEWHADGDGLPRLLSLLFSK